MRVNQLTPGDVVRLPDNAAVFVVRTPHPLYTGMDLVVWRLRDRSWSHDALMPDTEVHGTVDHTDDIRRRQTLRWALHDIAVQVPDPSVPPGPAQPPRCSECGGPWSTGGVIRWHTPGCTRARYAGSASNPERGR